jgi:hypothetical protein
MEVTGQLGTRKPTTPSAILGTFHPNQLVSNDGSYSVKLTKTEADLLLPIGETEFAGTEDEFKTLVTNTYWVIDDAPLPYQTRNKQMSVLSKLAAKHGFTIDLF